MGSYEEALRSASESGDAAPDITASRHPGRTKRGVGVNIGGDLGEWSAFLRTGWSDGKNESFAYTEIDRTVSLGVAHAANFLGRPKDTLVMGFVASGLSSLHRRYLAAGGIGFQIGDGRLNYACEQVLEGNYNAQVTRNVSLAIDVQRVWNPGYNHDRGDFCLRRQDSPSPLTDATSLSRVSDRPSEPATFSFSRPAFTRSRAQHPSPLAAGGRAIYRRHRR